MSHLYSQHTYIFFNLRSYTVPKKCKAGELLLQINCHQNIPHSAANCTVKKWGTMPLNYTGVKPLKIIIIIYYLYAKKIIDVFCFSK